MRQVFNTGCLAIGLSFVGFTADAQITVPENCSAVVTAHQSSCVTTAVFSCGDNILSHRFIGDTMISWHLYDAQWTPLQWVALQPGLMDVERVEQTALPATMATLSSEGRLPESGQFTLNTKVIKDRVYTLSGETTLSDEVVTIDGLDFRTGKVSRLFSPKPGSDGISFEIEIFVSEEHNLILEGDMKRSAFGSKAEVLQCDIQELHFEGDAGFLQLNREHGCG